MPQILLVFFLGLFWSFPVRCEQVFSLALGGIEEGDERYRPEWIARYIFNGSFLSELHYYGRIQGHIRQSTQILTLAYNYPVLSSKIISARVGAAISRDEAVIRSSLPDVATRRNEAYNLGAYFGIGVQFGSKMTFSADWNNAQFLAGASGIFLATARKQSLSLGVGWRL